MTFNEDTPVVRYIIQNAVHEGEFVEELERVSGENAYRLNEEEVIHYANVIRTEKLEKRQARAMHESYEDAMNIAGAIRAVARETILTESQLARIVDVNGLPYDLTEAELIQTVIAALTNHLNENYYPSDDYEGDFYGYGFDEVDVMRAGNLVGNEHYDEFEVTDNIRRTNVGNVITDVDVEDAEQVYDNEVPANLSESADEYEDYTRLFEDVDPPVGGAQTPKNKFLSIPSHLI